MGIDLRGRNICVSEQGLHYAQVGAIVQQMTGEGMAQHVRAQTSGLNAAGLAERFELAGEMLSGEVALRAKRREEPFRWRVAFAFCAQFEVFGHRAFGLRVERYETLLGAFAAHNEHALILS